MSAYTLMILSNVSKNITCIERITYTMLSAARSRCGIRWGRGLYTSQPRRLMCSRKHRIHVDRSLHTARVLFRQQRCGAVATAHVARAAAAATQQQGHEQGGGGGGSYSCSYAAVVGFAPDELEELSAYCADAWPDAPLVLVAADGDDGGNGGGALLTARVGDLLDVTDGDTDSDNPASRLLAAASAAAASNHSEQQEQRQQRWRRALWGRAVFFLGGPARALAAALGEALVDDLGQRPAIVAAAHAPVHADLPLGAALAAVRAAHAKYHDLVQPVATRLESGAPPPPLSEPPTLALNCVIDRGTVETADGGTRDDEACVVALDGLLTPEEAAALLAWLDPPATTAAAASGAGGVSAAADGEDGGEGGASAADGSGGSKWERACVDRPGGAPTFGLRAGALAALRFAPPPAAVALQARLQALYPEYIVAHMPPSTALLGDEDEDEGGEGDDGDGGGAPPPLSAHVANAVLPGDLCAWHLDMDPLALPLYSPFAEHVGGAYHNRDPRRPRFVSALCYLNPEWCEDRHAETLFADPLTGAGVFVQPRPGRVVLMDQDAPHRIGAPAAGAPAPRYSLVWKLVFWPRGLAVGDGDDGGDDGGAGESDQPPPPPPLCRPDWGAPQRIGSAAGLPVQVPLLQQQQQ